MTPAPRVCLAGEELEAGGRRLTHGHHFFGILARGRLREASHKVHTPMTTPNPSTRVRRVLRLLPSAAASE